MLPLICPSCRSHTKRGLELSALALAQVVSTRSAGARGKQPEEIIEGILQCKAEACGRRYPIIDGIPVLLIDPLIAGEVIGLTAQPLSPEVLAELARPGPDDAPLPHSLESLGAYLDSSWGDCATPPPDGPVPRLGFAGLDERLLERASARVPQALELGCGIGRGLSALSKGADLVVGIDRNPAALRIASRILRGEEVPFPRRNIGRTYSRATIRAADRAAPEAQLICADVIEPPLAPGGFQRVAALNLLDAVRAPRALLHHLHQLCSAGGEILLASPYAWRTGVTLDEERIGGSDPVAGLAREAAELGWKIEDEAARVPWTLRRDARAASLYEVHWLRARKPA